MTTATLTGTGVLTRFFLRRERIALIFWLLGGTFVYYSQAVGVDLAYPTQADLDRVAASMQGNAAMVAMAGPPRVLDTIGGQVAFQASAFGMIVAGLMSMFLVGRHTRANEETGRDELIRSGVVGRHAAFTGATLVTVLANLVYGLAVALSLISYGLPAAGSIALGVGASCAGLVFMAIALLAAQLTESTRAVYGITGAAIAVAYVLRAVGDVGNGVLSWLSPLGWGQAMRPYDGEVWWPALLSLAVAVAITLVARRVLDHRDFGAGVLPPRPGPARAGESLRSAFGLAWRLQRGSLIGWSIGMLLAGLAFGSIGDDVSDLLGDVDLAELLGQDVGSLVDAFYAMSAGLLALIGSAYTISAGLRPRAEEAAGRVEPLLSTDLPRLRWLSGHLVIMLAGSAVVLALGGFGMGLMYGVMTGDMSQLLPLLGASLTYLPAVWVLGAITVVLFGFLPLATVGAWIALAFCFVVLMFGATLKFPDWLMSISPFDNIPLVPAVDFAPGPVLITAVVALVLCAVGAWGFRHRDIETN
ncbi:ABC transporter permease [Nocardia cyriacigeorgica]|uniref:ABC transporter permease n=1 Tax=Nocardia cyriacigeorgica TaxID=135487 RepID=UPI001894F13A|nr:ABC transporter permease [Nocardia cyriacigeorgica]MBF6088069.1 ABC transporter permease [Nocardia cyriacigeorgica]MBF6094013.1 ABC transporter permease [Nocardia cyriacigeorgica]MBF6096773.1 ABC transporter permease [Nocardia cyriacigeorgica]MBF6162605.1 ABC transporter permease [Nocardia cyriacigeorgica]MBF6198064.1 ABC transporter permease [Nocardia cyriacigeorgica]